MLEDEAVARRKWLSTRTLPRPRRRHQSDPRPQLNRNDDPYRLSARRLARPDCRRHLLCAARRPPLHANRLDLCRIRRACPPCNPSSPASNRPFWQSSSAPSGGWALTASKPREAVANPHRPRRHRYRRRRRCLPRRAGNLVADRRRPAGDARPARHLRLGQWWWRRRASGTAGTAAIATLFSLGPIQSPASALKWAALLLGRNRPRPDPRRPRPLLPQGRQPSSTAAATSSSPFSKATWSTNTAGSHNSSCSTPSPSANSRPAPSSPPPPSSATCSTASPAPPSAPPPSSRPHSSSSPSSTPSCPACAAISMDGRLPRRRQRQRCRPHGRSPRPPDRRHSHRLARRRNRPPRSSRSPPLARHLRLGRHRRRPARLAVVFVGLVQGSASSRFNYGRGGAILSGQ